MRKLRRRTGPLRRLVASAAAGVVAATTLAGCGGGGTGAPVLTQAVAYLDCEVRERVQAGDHTFFVADVVSVERGPAQNALLYLDRSYHGL